MKDGIGRESRTLRFVTIAFATITIAFIISWWDGDGISLKDYGISFGAILAPWIGREWVKK
jgi:hypothetical protein